MRCVLGIDSGGSKCHVILVRDDGELLGWAKTDPGTDSKMAPIFGGLGRSPRVVLDTIQKAMGTNQADELHIGVVGGRFPAEVLTNGRLMKIQVHMIDEATAAFALAGVRHGVCVLSGTGAFVHGLTRDGRSRHLDGLGPLLGDRGSGYEIGLRTIQAAARSGWHPRHHATFANAVLSACGGRPNDPLGISLIEYMAVPRDRSEIAYLSRFTLAAAMEGDAVAVQILRDAAAALAETVFDVVDQLHMMEEDYPLVGTGGIIASSNLYWDHLCGLVKAFAPRLASGRAELPPVVGVVLAALERIPGVDFQSVRARLCACCRDGFEADKSAGRPARQGGR